MRRCVLRNFARLFSHPTQNASANYTMVWHRKSSTILWWEKYDLIYENLKSRVMKFKRKENPHHSCLTKQRIISLDQRVTITENWLKWLMRAASVTLAGLLAFAFWLGTINAKVSSSEQTINKVYSAVLEDPNSLSVRTSLIEHRLTGVESRLTSVETRLTGVEDRLTKSRIRSHLWMRSLALWIRSLTI